MVPPSRKAVAHKIQFRVIYHIGKWLAFLSVISQLPMSVEAVTELVGNNLDSFIDVGWEVTEDSDSRPLPGDFQDSLQRLDREVTGNGVWVEHATSFKQAKYIFNLVGDVCDITTVKVSIKYFANGASSYVFPCKDGPGDSEFCYLANPSDIEWKTDTFVISRIDELQIDMMLTGGFIMFDSVTIEHDGNNCVTTTLEPTTTTGGTTGWDATASTTDWDPTDYTTDWDLTESTTDWDPTESTTDWDPTDSTTDSGLTESTTPDGTTWETTTDQGSTVTHDPEGTAGTWIPVTPPETTTEPSTVTTEPPTTPTIDPTATTELGEEAELPSTEESTAPPSTTEETTPPSTTEETTPPSTTDGSTLPSSSESEPPSSTEESATDHSTTEEYATEDSTTGAYSSSTPVSSTTTEVTTTTGPTSPTGIPSPSPTTTVPPITGLPSTEYPTTLIPPAEGDDGGLSTKEVLLFIILPIGVTLGLVAFLGSVFYFGLRKNPIGGVKRWFRKGSTGGLQDTNANDNSVSADQERALTGASHPVHQVGMQQAPPTMPNPGNVGSAHPITNFGNAPPPAQMPAMSSPIYSTPDTRMIQDEPRVGRSRAPSTMYSGEYSRPEQPGNLQLPRIRRKLD